MLTISVGQALLLGLFSYFSNGGLVYFGYVGALIMQKPIVAALICGIIMGDPATAILIGCTIQAVYIGAANVAGVTSLPAINMSVWFAIPVAMTIGGDVSLAAQAALTICLACGPVETALRQLMNVVRAAILHVMDAAVHKGDLRKAKLIAYGGSQALAFLQFALPVPILCLLGQEAVVSVVNMLPYWLLGCLGSFTKLLPLLGFMILLSGLLKNKAQWILFVFGFALVKAAGLSVLTVTIIALAVAYVIFLCSGKEEDPAAGERAETAQAAPEEPDGEKARLAGLKNDKRFIRRMYVRLMFHLNQLFTMERMQGPTMELMVADAANDLYPGQKEKQVDLVERHMVFFNTQPTLGSVIWGITLGMEIERARTGQVPNDMIQTIKTALAGPFAGFGDTIWQILFVPILLSITLGLSSTGSAFGPVFAILVYVTLNLALTYILFGSGVRLGAESASKLINSSMKDRLLTAIETLGIIVVGATVGNLVNLQAAISFDFGGTVIDLQTDVLNAIYPGLLTLIGTFITYYFVKVKKVSANKIMLGMFVVGAIGYFTGLIAP